MSCLCAHRKEKKPDWNAFLKDINRLLIPFSEQSPYAIASLRAERKAIHKTVDTHALAVTNRLCLSARGVFLNLIPLLSTISDCPSLRPALSLPFHPPFSFFMTLYPEAGWYVCTHYNSPQGNFTQYRSTVRSEFYLRDHF